MRAKLILMLMLAGLGAWAQSPQDYVVMRAWEHVRMGAVDVSPFADAYALWDFNDPADTFTAGGIIRDRNGNSHLTVGATAIGTTNINGRTVSVWNGSSTEARRAEANWNSAATNGTVLIWVFVDADAPNQYSSVFASCNEASANYILNPIIQRETTAKYLISFFINSGNVTQTSSPVNSFLRGGWRMIANTRGSADGADIRLNINGVNQTVNHSGTQRWFSGVENRDNITIGYRQPNSKQFHLKGKIAVVAVYNTPKTDTELLDLYNATSIWFE